MSESRTLATRIAFNLCILLNIFTKDEFKLEMFLAVCWKHSKWWVFFIVRSTVPVVTTLR